MDTKTQQAYDWAIKQQFGSVAATHARTLAQYIRASESSKPNTAKTENNRTLWLHLPNDVHHIESDDGGILLTTDPREDGVELWLRSDYAAAPKLADALREAKQFIATLYKEYTPNIIPPNSDSGLNWDVRYAIDAALAAAGVTQDGR